jgi:hypothetical protein
VGEFLGELLFYLAVAIGLAFATAGAELGLPYVEHVGSGLVVAACFIFANSRRQGVSR